MRRVEFAVDGAHYRIEVDAEVLSMSQRVAGRWVEVARLTVAAAVVLAGLDVTSDRAPRPAVRKPVGDHDGRP